MKSLGAFATMVALLEAGFYAALTPLLPSLESELGLSQAASGLLGAMYPVGMALATVPSGLAADRLEPRIAARAGIGLLAVASLGFGLGSSGVFLAAMRLLQGAGAAAAWAGALALMAGASGAKKRGRVLGSTIAAAYVGMVIGPVIGVLAGSAGRETVFVPMAVLLAGVAAWGGPRPDNRRRPAAGVELSLRALRDAAVMLALLLMVVTGILLGALQTLGSLFLADRGITTEGIALVFIVGYGSQAALTPIIGRTVDRAGPLPAISVGMGICASALILTPLVGSSLVACALLATGTSAEAAVYVAVAVLISRIADARDLSQGMPMALTNGSWGIGAAVGAAALNAVADGFGDVSAFLTAAGLCGVALAVLVQPATRARLMT